MDGNRRVIFLKLKNPMVYPIVCEYVEVYFGKCFFLSMMGNKK